MGNMRSKKIHNIVPSEKKSIFSKTRIRSKSDYYFENFETKNNYGNLNIDEIDRRIEILQKDLLWIRIKKETNQEIKSSDIKMGKRIIAQLLSVKRNKQIEQAIDRSKYRSDKSQKPRLN